MSGFTREPRLSWIPFIVRCIRQYKPPTTPPATNVNIFITPLLNNGDVGSDVGTGLGSPVGWKKGSKKVQRIHQLASEGITLGDSDFGLDAAAVLAANNNKTGAIFNVAPDLRSNIPVKFVSVGLILISQILKFLLFFTVIEIHKKIITFYKLLYFWQNYFNLFNIYTTTVSRWKSLKRYRKSTILIGILLGILFFTSISHANFIEDTTLTFRKKLTFDYQLPKQVEKILETDYKDLEIFDNADYAYVFDFYKRKPDFSRSQFSDVKTTNLHFMGIADFNGDNSEDLVILTKNKFTHQKTSCFWTHR